MPSEAVAPDLLIESYAFFNASPCSLAAFCMAAEDFMALVAKNVSPATTPLIRIPPGTSKLSATAAICMLSVMASTPSLNWADPLAPLAMAT